MVGTQTNAQASNKSRGESKKDSGKNATLNYVRFYDAQGEFMRSIKIPGTNICAVSWEGADLRLSLAVDSFIYFANIRHQYIWTYFLNTVVFSYPKPDRRESAIVFWDLVSYEPHTKYVQNLKFLVSAGDLCAVVISEPSLDLTTEVERESSSEDNNDAGSKAQGGTGMKKNIKRSEVYTIQLRNAIGAVVDSKVLPFVPKYISMSPFHVVAANHRTVYAWQFQSQMNKSGLATATSAALTAAGSKEDGTSSSSARSHQSKLRIFDVSNTSFTTAQSPETFQISTDAIPDPISCTAVSDKYLVVARKGGSVTRFNLPHLTPENTYTMKDGREPTRIELNCASTKLGLVDSSGVFTILDLEARISEGEEKDGSAGSNKYILGPYYGRRLPMERKDVWDIKWSEDDPDMIVIMEKTKMVVFHGEEAEDPVVSSAYLARFRDLEIRAVALDDLIQHPDKVTAIIANKYLLL